MERKKASGGDVIDGYFEDLSHTKQSGGPSKKEVHRVAPAVNEKSREVGSKLLLSKRRFWAISLLNHIEVLIILRTSTRIQSFHQIDLFARGVS